MFCEKFLLKALLDKAKIGIIFSKKPAGGIT
jgi:hypothetical protein